MNANIEPWTYHSRDATGRRHRDGDALIATIEDAETPVRPYLLLLAEPSMPLHIKARGSAPWLERRLTGATRYTLCEKTRSTTSTEVIDSSTADALITSWARWAEQARGALDRAVAQKRPGPTPSPRLRVQRLAAIQAALGLTTQDLATVLSLSRPQLYRWLDADDDVRIQDAKRQRLDAVERITKAWQLRSPAPLRSVAHEPLSNGSSLFALLSAEAIDEPVVRAAFDELITKLGTQPRTLSQRMAKAGFTRRPGVGSLPSDE